MSSKFSKQIELIQSQLDTLDKKAGSILLVNTVLIIMTAMMFTADKDIPEDLEIFPTWGILFVFASVGLCCAVIWTTWNPRNESDSSTIRSFFWYNKDKNFCSCEQMSEDYEKEDCEKLLRLRNRKTVRLHYAIYTLIISLGFFVMLFLMLIDFFGIHSN